MSRIINMDDTISPPLNDHIAFEPKRLWLHLRKTM